MFPQSLVNKPSGPRAHLCGAVGLYSSFPSPKASVGLDLLEETLLFCRLAGGLPGRGGSSLEQWWRWQSPPTSGCP